MNRNQLYFRSSSFKMALLFTVLLSAAVLSLGYFIYDFGREGYQRDSEAALDALISTVLLEVDLNRDESLSRILDRRLAGQAKTFYLLTDIQGKRLAGNLGDFPAEVDRIIEGVILFEAPRTGKGGGRTLKLAAKIHTFPDGRQLLVARDIEQISNRFARLRLLSILSILCMLSVILVSFLISIFVVTRINRISSIALNIMETGDLSKRLAIDSRWDDLSHMSRVLNEMLDRIEGLVAGVKSVSDNIAHDLRTPLTRFRNRLEAARQHGLPPEEIETLIEEADRLLETFRSILRISQMEGGQDRTAFSVLNLSKVLADVVDLYAPLAEEKQVSLNLSAPPEAMAWGDRHLLFQIFANLLDNAIKHTGEGTAVTCSTRITGNHTEVRIEDTGPGIPDEDKERVFERFYRGDPSRSIRGSGLGLSLVAAAVRLHGGTLHLEDVQPSGLRVILVFCSSPPKITKS